MVDLAWYYPFYALAALTAAGILLTLSLYAWHRRSVTGATGFFAMMCVGWVWMLFAALELLVQDVSLKSFFNNIRYSGVACMPFAAMVAMLEFTGRGDWLRTRWLLGLIIIPLLGLLMIWTNELHHLLWHDYVVRQVGQMLVPQRHYGWWFYVQTGYNQVMALLTLSLLIHAIATQRPPYRSQALLMLLGASSVFLADVLWLFHLVPGPGLYPFSLIFLGLLMAWALFRYQLFDLVPVTHQALIQSMGDSLFVLDSRLRLVELNPAAQRLSGCTPAEAIGKPAAEVLAPQLLAHVQRATDQVVHVDLVCERHGGPQMYEAQITPLHTKRGLLAGHFIVLRDITERKQIEQALRISEERFRMLAENAQHIIFRLALLPTPHFAYISPAVTAITGYTTEEVYADPKLYLRAAHSESIPVLQQLSAVGATPGEPIIVRYFRKDGREIWVEQEQWTIHDADGQRVAVEGVARDVTWRKEAERQRAEQQQALTIFRERERLARELHDSLGQVLGYVNTQAQAARDLVRAAEVPRATAMLDQIIAVAQHELIDVREYILGVQVSGASPPPTPDDAAQGTFFKTLEEYLETFTRMSGITGDLDLPPGLAAITLAPTVELHLLRIIQEALTNVRKHAHATRVAVHVTVDASVGSPQAEREEERARWLAVSIEDNGRGFTPPAFASTPPNTTGGYGLHSMRGRAEEFGGSLVITATPSGGTCVTAHIPLRRQYDIRYRPLRLLLVDDNALFLRGLADLLVGRGFQVLGTAADGFAAFEAAQRLLPDVILMDVQMPGCDGLEATRMITQALPTIQIVMLTASDDEAHLFEALKSGASGYLLKSLDGDELCNLLRGVVQGEVPLSPGLARKVLHELARREPSAELAPEVELSEQQAQVLQMVAQGRTYREIGDRLGYAERTIKKYATSHTIARRLPAHRRGVRRIQANGARRQPEALPRHPGAWGADQHVCDSDESAEQRPVQREYLAQNGLDRGKPPLPAAHRQARYTPLSLPAGGLPRRGEPLALFRRTADRHRVGHAGRHLHLRDQPPAHEYVLHSLAPADHRGGRAESHLPRWRHFPGHRRRAGALANQQHYQHCRGDGLRDHDRPVLVPRPPPALLLRGGDPAAQRLPPQPRHPRRSHRHSEPAQGQRDAHPPADPGYP